MHPDLGTLADFRAFVRRAAALGIETASTSRCRPPPITRGSPSIPTGSPSPDGTIRYAENPPKKYQDIYPVNFDDDPEGIFDEVLIVRHWIKQGVRIFRVDNPHTKPLTFWERLIAAVNADDPDVVFRGVHPPRDDAGARDGRLPAVVLVLHLAEHQAGARGVPHLGVAGHRGLHAAQPLREHPRHPHRVPPVRRPAAFTVRATIAATAAPTWGVYSGFELFESVARPGAEEAIDNEKYEFKPRDFAAAEKEGRSLALYLGILNGIRNAHPALGQLRNIRFHASEDDSVLVYSKHLDGRSRPTAATTRSSSSRTSIPTP